MIIPYTTERRQDTGMTNVRLGMWLFIASEIMLFGALFSSYALLRASATNWPSGLSVLNLTLGATATLILVMVTIFVKRARKLGTEGARTYLIASTTFAAIFIAVKVIAYAYDFAQDHVPSASTFLAMYFTLTGMHALHVIAGMVANVWAIMSARRIDAALFAGRVRALAIYWLFVEIIWFIIFVVMYLL